MGNYWTLPSKASSIDDHVTKHCIVMYSTTVCGYCTKAKDLLTELKLDYNVVELNLLSQEEGGKVTGDLIDKTRVRTVPQIFINGEFIGGYSEMLTLKQAGLLFSKADQCRKQCGKDV